MKMEGYSWLHTGSIILVILGSFAGAMLYIGSIERRLSLNEQDLKNIDERGTKYSLGLNINFVDLQKSISMLQTDVQYIKKDVGDIKVMQQSNAEELKRHIMSSTKTSS